jgi:hypothetical protein
MSIPSHGSGCITKTYPMKCKGCGVEVFHLACSCGSSVVFENLATFELHPNHPTHSDEEVKYNSISLRFSFSQSEPLRELLLPAIAKWRRADVLVGEPQKLSSLKYEIILKNLKSSALLEPLSTLILGGVIIETLDQDVLPDLSTRKAETLNLLAQQLVREQPYFFEIKGPGLGDNDTAVFMKQLRSRALRRFKIDYSEEKICGQNSLCVDFYFPDEETIVEVALGLRNPLSEYERDILKAIMAREAGYAVSRLLFISKPGAIKRLAQPSAKCIAEWAQRNHGVKIHVRELTAGGK